MLKLTPEGRHYRAGADAAVIFGGGPDLNAVNARDDPDQVKPVSLGGVRFEAEGRIQATLTPASWTMLRFEAAP